MSAGHIGREPRAPAAGPAAPPSRLQRTPQATLKREHVQRSRHAARRARPHPTLTIQGKR